MKVERVLVAGHAKGDLLILDEPVSFWGGIDTETGRIVDPTHPQNGISLGKRLIYLPHARGSSGTSSALTELMRGGLAPAGIILESGDSMLTVGSLVGQRLYNATCPIVVATLPDDPTGTWVIDGDSLEKSAG